jgi:hypothetical protein
MHNAIVPNAQGRTEKRRSKWISERELERSAIEGDGPVHKNPIGFRWFLSSAQHEELRVNPPRPLGKAKHDLSPIVHPVP